ncbi:flagellar protein FlaG [Fervidibacillus albus]|uniref:Flagellar protein FlaG n=1 Tax=Fervidibacillus albus TaxID=2980026 RepID=A0A9E8LUM7_9BACI|nr:flagellar protein FlaG [Fervidibacillus albus]WAA09802.1 flagellar protein FlaG [Fervidibacillus albus]
MIDKISSQQHVISNITDVKTEGRETELRANLRETENEETSMFELKGYSNLEKKEQLENLVSGLNDFLTPVYTSLKFELHEKLDEYYVTVIDDSTKEVIKEIPPKKLLDMYAAMLEYVGIIVDEKI